MYPFHGHFGVGRSPDPFPEESELNFSGMGAINFLCKTIAFGVFCWSYFWLFSCTNKTLASIKHAKGPKSLQQRSQRSLQHLHSVKSQKWLIQQFCPNNRTKELEVYWDLGIHILLLYIWPASWYQFRSFVKYNSFLTITILECMPYYHFLPTLEF